MKTKLSKNNITQHLHYGHLAIIAGCVVFLVGSMVMKNGFSLSSLTARAGDDGSKKLSYEEIKKQVAAESNVVMTDPDKLAEQVAMLDSGSRAGKVLGESIGLKVSEPKEISQDPRYQNIKVLTISGMQKSDILRYSNDLIQIETQNNGALLLAFLNSDDPVALEQAMLSSSAIALLLEEVYVPAQLAAFHKVKIIYYKSLEQIARNFAQQQPTETLQQATSDMFSAINAMSPVRTTIYSRYQVQI